MTIATARPVDIAWAAGFFDGEGSTCLRWSHGKYPSIQLSISQSGEGADEVLQRWCDVFSFGNVCGPYIRERGKHIYRLQLCGWREVQASLAAMWPFLTPVKREQARDHLVAVQDYYRAKGAAA